MAPSSSSWPTKGMLRWNGIVPVVMAGTASLEEDWECLCVAMMGKAFILG